MAIVWPPGLPAAPLLGSYTKRLPKLTLRSSVDAGFDKVRRRFTAAPTLHDMGLKLTRAQVAIFRVFFLETTKGGALPFTWKDHETGEACDFRFVDEPKYRPLAPRQSGTEYWETEVFTLEELPVNESDDGGDPPPPYMDYARFDEEGEAVPEADVEALFAGAVVVTAAPTPGYFPWIYDVGESEPDAPPEDMTLSELYGDSAATCGVFGSTDTNTGESGRSVYLGSDSNHGSIGSSGIGGYIDC